MRFLVLLLVINKTTILVYNRQILDKEIILDDLDIFELYIEPKEKLNATKWYICRYILSTYLRGGKRLMQNKTTVLLRKQDLDIS